MRGNIRSNAAETEIQTYAAVPLDSAELDLSLHTHTHTHSRNCYLFISGLYIIPRRNSEDGKVYKVSWDSVAIAE